MDKQEFELLRKTQWDLLMRYDKYISDTNMKASILMSLQSVLIGLILTNFTAFGRFLENDFCCDYRLSMLTRLYCFAVSSVIVCRLVLIVIPDIRSDSTPSKFFFVDVAKDDPLQRKAFFENQSKEMIEDLFFQVKFVARALSKKMQDLRIAYKLVIYAQITPLILFVICISLQFMFMGSA